MNTYEIDSCSNFQMQYGTVNYSYQAIHYILVTYSSFNWKFLPFECPLYKKGKI